MNSKVEVVNNALVFLGQIPVQVVDSSTKAGTFAGTLWNAALEETLRAHPWNFACYRKELSPLSDNPKFGYSYQFNKPSDWLRTIEIFNTRDFRNEGRQILANVEFLQMRYIRKVEELNVWDSLAAAALARNLAAKLAYPLTQSTSQQNAQWEMYVAVLQQARSVDSMEEPADEFEESDLIAGRY